MSHSPAKRSITIARHRTSVSVEDEFWAALGAIAAKDNISIAKLVEEIDQGRGRTRLSVAIRLYVLKRTQQDHIHR